MVDRWLFRDYQRNCLANFTKISCKAGWAPLPAGYQFFEAVFPVGCPVAATDFTSYDWTWNEWLVSMFTRGLLNLVRKPHLNYTRAVVTRMAEVLGPSFRLRLPCGVVFRQRIWGIMKSGFFMTLLGNSNCVEMIVYSAWLSASIPFSLPEVWTLGDDMFMRLFRALTKEEREEFIRCVESCGVKVKRYSTIREFAGFEFPSAGVVEPAYPDKHKFELEWSKDLPQHAESLALIYPLSSNPLAGWIVEHQTRPYYTLRAWAHGIVDLPKQTR